MRTAKLFMNGRSQAVRLPAEFRFDGDEVLIRRDDLTGEVILSPRKAKFEDWLAFRDAMLVDVPQHELDKLDDLRDRGPTVERDWP